MVAGPYGEPLAVTGGENAKDHGIELWNLQGQPIRTATLRSPDQKNRSVESLSYSQNGRRLAVSYGNAAIDIWTLEGTPQRIRALSTDPFTIAGGGLATMAFSPEEDTLVGGDRFGTVHLWYLNDSKPRLSSLRGLEGPVDVLAYSHDGNQIAAAGSQQGRILVWSVRRPKQLPIILEGHEKGVRSIVFARDGARLYSSGAEDTVRVWRLYSRDLLRFARDTVHRPPLRQFEFLNLVQPFFPDLEFSPHLNSCERVLRREGKP